jgi:MORN repeat variant
MFKSYNPLIVLLLGAILAGCAGKGSKKGQIAEADTTTVPDTGFTGIKKYYSNKLLIKEITFKNGVRQGEMRSFYQGGQLRQTFWYENGLREDSSKWYYLEGQVFRSTPYRHDTIHGTQKQYYRNGRLKAKLNYFKGLRTPELEEFTNDGKLVSGYPDIMYTFTDNYSTTGKVRLNLSLSDKSTRVKFYRGDFTDGVFDSTKCSMIKAVNGKAFVDLRKTNSPQVNKISIIAVVLTDFGNNYFAHKKIDLPYKDLK